MYLGFALTQHCNLRCPHCIRDDVATARSLEVPLLASVLDQALELFGGVTVGLTGGEPLIHPEFAGVVDIFRERGVPYRFVSNGWHLKRIVRILDGYPAQAVRLSLSGATEAVHDAERGRGSFRRVMLGMAILTSRSIPASLALIVDRRTRHQIREMAELAEALGATELHFMLPQPVPESLRRGSDIPPSEWPSVRDEIDALVQRHAWRTRIQLTYGAPVDGPEPLCDTKAFRRIYVDVQGRLSLCCQLSEYGFNENDVVANLHEVPFATAWRLYQDRVGTLTMAGLRPEPPAGALDALPCMRCARACGKLGWMRSIDAPEWTAEASTLAVPAVVRIQADGAGWRGRRTGAAIGMGIDA